uniref:Probable DNA helicase MCM9 n=1 Tax=Albugo laibachii Nc14 TaxID=890382 RepID=F0W0E9_9STRA|nr:DNA replication licensing factor MCM9 putative [Albugo laibachii Nc14]|eukprot:CCA14521.1 DNA replication licensing factor MCM9 putative [Albugo laibachii Nc14]
MSGNDVHALLQEFSRHQSTYIRAFKAFLYRCHHEEIRVLCARYATLDRETSSNSERALKSQSVMSSSLLIDAHCLIDFDPNLGILLLQYPEKSLHIFNKALNECLEAADQSSQHTDKSQQSSFTHPSEDLQRFRHTSQIRVENLPPLVLYRKPMISKLRSNDINQLIQLSGIVVRTGMIKMHEQSREYICSNLRCRYQFLVTSDPEQGNVLQLPKVCPSESTKPCRSTNFELVEGSQIVSDHQVIKVQEQVSRLGIGSIPRSITIILEDELVDVVHAGDHIVVVGILSRCWKPCVKDVRCDVETFLKANSVRIKNAASVDSVAKEKYCKEFQHFWHRNADEPMAGRDEIIASICPKVFGLYIIKLAVVLTIIGGCSHVDDAGLKVRGESHLLLIGDPGTGKSQLLRFAAELSPRSVLTTGIGTTSAGLTCAAVKDGGEWMLDAGALVLADRGLCCIDEFNSIRSHDRTSIHEAMEQQCLSVAKAGLVCRLQTRTSIIAATNPQSRYALDAGLAAYAAIGTPLLSRFDLIFILQNRNDAEWDRAISAFILQIPDSPAEKPEVKDANSSIWSIDKLQAYIGYVKEGYQPKLGQDSMMILERYYQMQRSDDNRNAARTTIRMLESLTRLAQAHARLMWHQEVQAMDAIVAVYIMEVSKATEAYSELLGSENVESIVHASNSSDPVGEYALQERRVLEYLQLTELSQTRETEAEVEERKPTCRPELQRSRFDFGKWSQDPTASITRHWNLK